MANGIEDLMNIRTTGGTQNVPPRPPMQGGLASMGSGQPTMPPVVDDQMSMPPMGGQEMPSEQPQEMSIEQDAAMLAEATIGRTGGDPEAAVATLDTAKAMLMQGGQEEPMMMNSGGPIYAQDGTALQNWSRENLPFYELIAEEKMPDTDVLKEMIMNNLATRAATANSQTGRAISDKDINFQKEMIMNSIRDINAIKNENPVLNSEGAYNITSPMGQNVRTAVSQLSNDVLGRDVSDNRSNKVLAKDFLQGADGSNPYSDVSKDELRGIYGKSRIFNMQKN